MDSQEEPFFCPSTMNMRTYSTERRIKTGKPQRIYIYRERERDSAVHVRGRSVKNSGCMYRVHGITVIISIIEGFPVY